MTLHTTRWHSLTHCCTWPAEGRSDLHNMRSRLEIWARPTDDLLSFSTCCSHVLLGRSAVISSLHKEECQCGRQLTVEMFLSRRQTWPNNEWRLSAMTDGKSGNFVLSLTGTFYIFSYRLIPRIRRSVWILSLYIPHCALSTFQNQTTLHKWAVNPELGE